MERIMSCENIVSEIMLQGFKNAEDSFSRFIGEEVAIINTTSILTYAEVLKSLSDSLSKSNTIVLTTDLMGEFAGRSYLFLKKTESEVVQSILSKKFKNAMPQEFLNAMLLEIDNVVSAAVITEISNQLKIKLYGGVPGVLQVIESRDYLNYITTEFHNDDINKFIFSETSFQLESNPDVMMKFVWKLHPKVLDFVLKQFGQVNNAQL